MGKVSVIIPTWNRQNSIKRCIVSALNQTYKDLEVIVSDDGSTDKTEQVVKSIGDPRIILIKGSHSGLPSVARNRGIEIASGEWVAFLDSDDEWVSNKIETQLYLLRNNKYEFCCSNAFVGDVKTIFTSQASRLLSFKTLLKSNNVITSSVLVSKKLVDTILFNEDNRFKAVEDYLLWLTLSSKGTSIYYDNKALVKYYYSDDSIGKKYNGESKKMALLLELLKSRMGFLSYYLLLVHIVKYFVVNKYYILKKI